MDIKYFYENTELTQKQIAEKLNISLKAVYKYIHTNYSSSFRKSRKAVCYRNSKLGDNNPMRYQTGELHPRFIGAVSDNKGYLMVVKPFWYTGRKGSKYVFLHTAVVCENLGISEVAKGWCVHHCDANPLNNSFDNLVLMTTSDHMKLHSSLRGATTISKESTLKWVEAHGTPWKRDDIVSSAQGCAAVKAALV